MMNQEYDDNMTPQELEFAVFCVGCIAEKLNRPIPEIYDLLVQNDILQNYIVEFYDVLHTQSKDYITEDIIRLLEERELI